MPNVFISYASADRAIAEQLSKLLRAQGQNVFFDQGAIAAGADLTASIEDALSHAKAVVVLLSRNSNRSKWVEAEVRHALEGGRAVISVLLDEEATNNWIWPLVSDRPAIRIDSPEQIEKVARHVNEALGGTAKSRRAPRALFGVDPRWVLLLVGFLSAMFGALATWLATHMR